MSTLVTSSVAWRARSAIKRLFRIDTHTLLRIYSHPRSGTHLLASFLGNNFYQGLNLNSGPHYWGHWSNRIHNEQGTDYGKLFGDHYFPETTDFADDRPSIYIYRDGRAVALSVWKTENFLEKSQARLPFSRFLREKLDWEGTPARRSEAKRTIVEHWLAHVQQWHSIKARNLCFVRYEDILTRPDIVANHIVENFPFLKKPDKAQIPPPAGILPNQGKIEEWKKYFQKEDLDFFFSIVPKDCPYLWPE